MVVTLPLALLLFTASTGFGVNVEQFKKGCESNPADIVFVLDESGSIWGPDFVRQTQFVKDVTKVMPVAKEKTHIGVMTFSDDTKEYMTLGQYEDEASITDVMDVIPQRRGGTKTFKALEKMRTYMFSSQFARPHVAHIAIIITDGESEDKDRTAEQARLAKQQGITVFAIGVGRSVNTQELIAIASEPTSEYMYEVPDYKALAKLRQDLAWKACQVTTLPPPTTTTTTTTTTTLPTTTLPQMIESCSGRTPVDVVFSLSDQAGVKQSDQAMDLIGTIVSEATISPIQVQAGLAPRNCFSTEEIKLNDHDSNAGFLRDVQKRRLTTIGAWTDLQLSYLNEAAFHVDNGARPNAVKYAVVIIDNVIEDIDRTLAEASSLRDKGVKLIVVGVGPYVDAQQLRKIAGNDDVINVPSYEVLTNASGPILDRICKSMLKNRRRFIDIFDY